MSRPGSAQKSQTFQQCASSPEGWGRRPLPFLSHGSCPNTAETPGAESQVPKHCHLLTPAATLDHQGPWRGTLTWDHGYLESRWQRGRRHRPKMGTHLPLRTTSHAKRQLGQSRPQGGRQRVYGNKVWPMRKHLPRQTLASNVSQRRPRKLP